MLDLCAENRACEIVVVQGFVVAGLPWGGVGPGGPSLGQCGEKTLHSSPPWQPTLLGFKYSGREGEGVAWSTLLPHYTERGPPPLLWLLDGRVSGSGKPR